MAEVTSEELARREEILAPYTVDQREQLERWADAMEAVGVETERLQELGVSQFTALGLIAQLAGEELPPLAQMMLGGGV